MKALKKALNFKILVTVLALGFVVPLFSAGCGGKKEDNTNQEAKAQAAMQKGAAPQSDKGQSFQAPPAPPP